MVSTTQRERNDRCGAAPTHPQISFGDADNHPLNRPAPQKKVLPDSNSFISVLLIGKKGNRRYAYGIKEMTAEAVSFFHYAIYNRLIRHFRARKTVILLNKSNFICNFASDF